MRPYYLPTGNPIASHPGAGGQGLPYPPRGAAPAGTLAGLQGAMPEQRFAGVAAAQVAYPRMACRRPGFP
eukprot:CAMPEP_0118860630 /NCGR_PEP_ID=MMETSP1163-20130328/6417_1 /TAXON_ID=124430 /ORGANISM="Phaeomonas parva, Strain CCMP2877" /LENGTH=69 /DNA_ID=CAMNT_0006794347 /DNA_START=127 /DNA_END=333 /DNA_ORIENTATION=+